MLTQHASLCAHVTVPFQRAAQQWVRSCSSSPFCVGSRPFLEIQWRFHTALSCSLAVPLVLPRRDVLLELGLTRCGICHFRLSCCTRTALPDQWGLQVSSSWSAAPSPRCSFASLLAGDAGPESHKWISALQRHTLTIACCQHRQAPC